MDIRRALMASASGNLLHVVSWWHKQCHVLYLIRLDNIKQADCFERGLIISV